MSEKPKSAEELLRRLVRAQDGLRAVRKLIGARRLYDLMPIDLKDRSDSEADELSQALDTLQIAFEDLAG